MDAVLLAIRLSGGLLIHQAGLAKIQDPAALVDTVGTLGFPEQIPTIALCATPRTSLLLLPMPAHRSS